MKQQYPVCAEHPSGHMAGCDACRRHSRIVQGAYRLRTERRARGAEFPQDLVDPAPAVKAMREAFARGMTYIEMARVSGVNPDTVIRIKVGKSKRITRANRDALVNALQDDDNRVLLDSTRVSNTWTVQMIKSLYAQGWTKKHQAYIIENNTGQSGNFVMWVGKKNGITVANEKLMKWLVKAIGENVGPSNFSRARGRTVGVFPTKHYNVKGVLIESTLSAEQRAHYERVR